VSELDATLAPKPPVGAIRGEIVTLTGAYTPKSRVLLAGERALPPLASDVVWTTVAGRKVGRFEFAALPEGTFQISVEKDDWFAWEPAKLSASAPREDLRILVRDDVATCDYALRARDRDNGLALERLHVWIEFRNGPARARRCSSDEVFEHGVPVEKRFLWRVDRAGYRSAHGDETSFALEEHRDGRAVRVLELDLTPGWGDVVRAVRRDGKTAIPGVEVLADGVPLGKTGKDGTLAIELRDPPSKLEARHPAWSLAGPPDLRPAWKRDDKRVLLLRMNPK
jgi:hypothetical protein